MQNIIYNIVIIWNDYPQKGQQVFQDPATDWQYAIIDLHDRIQFYLIIIQSVVLWFLTSAQLNKNHLPYLHHGNQIELIWTQTPAGIQWAIGLPSQRLLYIMDEIQDAEITIKAIGNQWYKFNAINKSKFLANKKKILKNQSLKNFPNLDPNWVTGFSDAEGCFSINIQKIKKGNRYISSTFKIALDYKDIQILYSLKNYFKVGQITIHKYEARLEINGFQNAINYVIPHFEKYPQITQKYADYLLWKNIIMIQKDKLHLTEEGFIKCLSLKASLNKGLNETLKTLYPKIIPVKRSTKELPLILNSYWLSGFVAGDGSFIISIGKHPTCVTGYQVQAIFNIGQHIKDIKQLNKIFDFQGCGNVFEYKNNNSKFVVSKLNNIIKNIIPYFFKYPLMNKKQQDFIIWCKIVTMIEKGEHQTNDGLNKIREMREKMN